MIKDKIFKFCEVLECPKCGNPRECEVEWRFHGPADTAIEVLRLQCDVCGYVWLEECKDKEGSTDA
jgi:C4-type Zn-finger protein